MQPSTILLVRHASANDRDRGGRLCLCGWHDIPLTEFGREQVRCLTKRLAPQREVAAVYTSPLQRARDTAMAGPARLTAQILPRLREIYCGALEGTPLQVIQSRHPSVWEANEAQADDDFGWPGGETYSELRTRAVNAIRWISSRHAGERVMVVTHAGVISQTLGFLAGIRPAVWARNRPGNASITELEWAGDDGRVLSFDDRSHLARHSATSQSRSQGDLPATFF